MSAIVTMANDRARSSPSARSARSPSAMRRRNPERSERVGELRERAHSLRRALPFALARDRALHRRDRDLDLALVGLAGRDLLEEEAGVEKHAQRPAGAP